MLRKRQNSERPRMISSSCTRSTRSTRSRLSLSSQCWPLNPSNVAHAKQPHIRRSPLDTLSAQISHSHLCDTRNRVCQRIGVGHANFKQWISARVRVSRSKIWVHESLWTADAGSCPAMKRARRGPFSYNCGEGSRD